MTEHSDGEGTNFIICPECGAQMPLLRGYVTWCSTCNWNLRPEHPNSKDNIFESISAKYGERLGRSLLMDILRNGASKPAMRPAHWLSYFLAAWVQIPGIALGVVGVWLLWQSRLDWWLILPGGACLWLAWATRPRFDRASQDHLTAQQYPDLYALVNKVAAGLGAKPVERIYPRPWFNASASREGRRGSPSLYLGLPLWAVLDGGEKLALLAHELAHLVNGDPSRGALVGAALEVLGRWYAMLRPAVPSSEQAGFPRLAMIPVNFVLSVLALVVWLHALALAALLWRDQQCAEYYADALAAKLCGSQAMLSLLEKLHHTRIFQSALGAWFLNSELQQRSFYAYLRSRIAQIPQRELERIRQVELLESSRLDTRHPPTVYRIHALQAIANSDKPSLSISDSEWEAVEKELTPVYQMVQSQLSKNYHLGLFS
jgi:Zn-dependent protease with chaperone function